MGKSGQKPKMTIFTYKIDCKRLYSLVQNIEFIEHSLDIKENNSNDFKSLKMCSNDCRVRCQLIDHGKPCNLQINALEIECCYILWQKTCRQSEVEIPTRLYFVIQFSFMLNGVHYRFNPTKAWHHLD